jgi:hypothetical protein
MQTLAMTLSLLLTLTDLASAALAFETENTDPWFDTKSL